MARGLTKKQKEFVVGYGQTGNGTQTVLKVYNVKNAKTASVIAAENLAKPSIQKALADRFPDDLLEKRHLELINKRQVEIVYEGRKRKPKIVELGPDTQAVSKGLEMAYKIKGSYAPEKSVSVHVNLNGEKKQKAKNAVKKFITGGNI